MRSFSGYELGQTQGHKLSRCAALQIQQRQSCVKVPISPLALHPNPSVPIYPHTKTKLHTNREAKPNRTEAKPRPSPLEPSTPEPLVPIKARKSSKNNL